MNQGWQAIVPERSLTLQDWTGVGYILQNPENGEGFYRIAGGYGGAVTLSAQDTEDRVNNITGSGFATVADNAAERRNYCRRYPGQDVIFGTADDSPCYTPYTEEEATRLDDQCTPSLYADALNDDQICLTRYAADPTNLEITEAHLIKYQEHGAAQRIGRYLDAQHWRSQDDAPFMRAGYTSIRAVGLLMKHFKVTRHGIETTAGAGFRTHARQKYLKAKGNPRACGLPLANGTFDCRKGHHTDGTAADIVLTGPEQTGGKVPTKQEVLCVAKTMIGFGEVLSSEILHEGTSGTVHIAKPAKKHWTDQGAYGWLCPR